MNKEYRKNHYIPVFYLKNFTNDKNHFFVFDKKSKWKSNEITLRSPNNICFEWDRNTLFLGDKAYTNLEKKTYGYFDNLHAETFKLLVESEYDRFPWSLRTVGDLEFFIPLLYWRSPTSDSDFTFKASNHDFIEQLRLKGINRSDKSEAKFDAEFRQQFANDININKAIRPLMAYSTFGKPHKIYDKLEWRIIYGKNKGVNLTSDNPIIFQKQPQMFDDFRSSLILPVSSNKSLIRVNEKVSFNYCHESFLQDILIFHQAKRYVISSDKEYLQNIAKEYKVFEKLGTINLFRDYAFEYYKDN
jgi:Protein of unknown function (DUF4238)